MRPLPVRLPFYSVFLTKARVHNFLLVEFKFSLNVDGMHLLFT